MTVKAQISNIKEEASSQNIYTVAMTMEMGFPMGMGIPRKCKKIIPCHL